MIRVKNHHPILPFRGWVRTTTDQPFLQTLGQWSNGDRYALGRLVGEHTRIVDVWCLLQPGESRVLDPMLAADWAPSPVFPPDLVAHFGGSLFPCLDGEAMTLLSLTVDGAALFAHFREAIEEAAVDLWLWWYPDEPAWCHGEALVTAGDPASSSVVFDLSDRRLTWGDAMVSVLGAGHDGQLLSPGKRTLADAQAVAVPVTFSWIRHCHEQLALSSATVAAAWQIGAVGVSQLLADGNPTYPPNFTPQGMISRFADAARRLHTWERNIYGPSIRSSDTGDQEDQTFVRGEALLPGGEGAELVTWLSAIKLHSERPCNHLEADGSPLEPANHVNPRLLFWDGRPHTYQSPPGNYVISPDQLGKGRALTLADSQGRYGPDIEHFLANTLAAACRLTGSPVAQRLLRNLCVVYLLQRTEPANWSVSTEGNWTRALGWEGIFVVHVWRDLEDRAMAQRVADRWRRRCSTLILPRLSGAPGDIWDVRTEPSASLPIVPGWMPWQQAVAAYGLDLACRVLGPSEGCPVALRAAKRVVDDAWVLEGSRWVEYERLSLAGDRSRSGYYPVAWLPCAVAVVLRYEPTHTKAREIWNQMLFETDNLGDRSWLPPGVD